MKKEYLSLKEIQEEELKILEKVTQMITKYNLRYTLFGGTLLGTIRHKGFIPWDDDIDIAMPRPDYDKFIKLFTQNNEYSELSICCPENRNTFLPFCKIINNKIETVNGSIYNQENGHLWIDIFPLDAFPANDRKARRICKKVDIYAKLIYVHQYKINWSDKKSFIKNIKKMIIKPISLFITNETIIKLISKEDYDTSKYIGNLIWGRGITEKRLKADFEEFISAKFEGKEFQIIKNYDGLLTSVYGDYMTVPPENERVSHNIKAYRLND